MVAVRRRTVVAGLLSAPFVRTAYATTFPTRPLRYVCGYLPGGTTDIICRIVAERLSGVFGQNVIVENRSGASGLIAAEAVARSAPDGYTVFQNSMAMHSIMPQLPGQSMSIDLNRELDPLANVGGVYNTLVVAGTSAARTVADLIARAKQNPGELTFGSAGIGTTHHLAGALFMKLAEVDMTHVPYRGSPAAVTDIIGGRCDMIFGNLPELSTFIRSGDLKALAFGSRRVSPLFPDVPLMSATLPGFAFSNWFGIAAPLGLPPEVRQVWTNALQRIAQDPELDRRFTQTGVENLIGTSEAIRDTIREDFAFWGELIRSSGLRAG